MQKLPGPSGKREKTLRSITRGSGTKTTGGSMLGLRGIPTSIEVQEGTLAERVCFETVADKDVTHGRSSGRRRNHHYHHHHHHHHHSSLTWEADHTHAYFCGESSPGDDALRKESMNSLVGSQINDSGGPFPDFSRDRSFGSCGSLSSRVISPYEGSRLNDSSSLMPCGRSGSALEKSESPLLSLPTMGSELKGRKNSKSSDNSRCTCGDDKRRQNEGHVSVSTHKEESKKPVVHNSQWNKKSNKSHPVHADNRFDTREAAPFAGVDQRRGHKVQDDSLLPGLTREGVRVVTELPPHTIPIEELQGVLPMQFARTNAEGEVVKVVVEEVPGLEDEEVKVTDSSPSAPPSRDVQLHDDATHLIMMKKDRSISRGGISCVSLSSKVSLRHPQRSYSFTPEVSSALCRLVEEHVVASLLQNVERMMPHRRKKLRRVAEYLTEAIVQVASNKGVRYGDIRYYVFGSVSMSTVLPDGDNDMTIEISGLLNPTKVPGHGQITDDFNDPASSAEPNSVDGCIAASSSQAAAIAGGELLSSVAEYFRQPNASIYVDALVLAEVRVLKLVMDGNSYDITVNQLGGVDCVRFLHEVDMMVGCQHLLKRTLLLLKAWCCYEAHVLSGQGGYISSYAATIMLIAMINTVEFLEDVEEPEKWEETGETEEDEAINKSSTKGGGNGDGDGDHDYDGSGGWGRDKRQRQYAMKEEVSPLQLFARFLKFFSYFDFEHYCVTVFGPLPCASINGTSLDLSRLEVPAARKKRHVDPLKSSCASQTGRQEEELVDVNCLGLTLEGQAALGHCIRRRAKPLVTVSGVKHMLRGEYVNRQRGRESPTRSDWTADEGALRDKTCENTAEGLEELRIDRCGCAEEDAQLSCTACDTINYPLRIMNVMDPLRWSASVCRGVCRNHLQRIRRAFREGLALFEMASTKLRDASIASSSSPSPVCSERSDGDASNAVLGACQTPGTAGDFLNGLGMNNSPLDSTKWSILRDLFGQTLGVLQRNSPETTFLASSPKLTRCEQCEQPSFFCIRDAMQVCDAQFIFKGCPDASSHSDDHGGWSSREHDSPEGTHNASLNPASFQHQQQHSKGLLACSAPMAPASLPSTPPAPAPAPVSASANNPFSAAASAVTPQLDPSQYASSVRGGWPGNGSHPNGDSSTSSLAMRHHLVRGRPLLRTCMKGLGGSRGQRTTPSAVAANGNLLYPAENPAFLCNSGYAGTMASATGCSPSMKCTGVDGASMGFALSPSLSSSSPFSAAAIAAGSSPSNSTRLPAVAASERHQGILKYIPMPLPSSDGIKGEVSNVNTMAIGSSILASQQPMMYAFGH